jgi:hypothetical protein
MEVSLFDAAFGGSMEEFEDKRVIGGDAARILFETSGAGGLPKKADKRLLEGVILGT